MTFDQLFRYSEPKRVVRSRTVRGPPLAVTFVPGNETWDFNFRSYPSTTGRRHKGYVKFFKKTNSRQPLEKIECEVGCQCEDFTYRWRWANKQRGSATPGEVNRAPRITNPGNRPGLCVAEGERIATNRGLVPIEQVVVGDMAWTLKGWKRVTASAQTGTKSIVTVTLASGRTIRVTPEHQVYSFDEATGFTWTKAGELSSLHKLCINLPADSCSPCPTYDVQASSGTSLPYSQRTISLNEDVAELLGYMVSEGSANVFSNESALLRNDFFSRWEKVFGQGSLTLVDKRDSCNGCFIGMHGTRIMQDLGFKLGSYNKVTPEWVMRGRRSVVAAYLRGCYAGDGNFMDNCSTYGTVSEPLARSIQLLLSTLGVHARISLHPAGINDSPTWFVRTSSGEETRRLFDLLNPLRGYSRQPSMEAMPAFHNYVASSAVRPLVRSAIAKVIKPAQRDERLVPVNEVYNYVPGCTKSTGVVDKAARILAAQGKLQQARHRTGGKPHNMAKICDLFDALEDYRVERMLTQLKIPRAKSDTFHKSKLIPFMDRLSEMAPAAHEELAVLCREDVTLDPVVSVNQGLVVPVYDLTIDSVEHFTVNGVVVHNCKHILATANYVFGQARGLQRQGLTTAQAMDRIPRQGTVQPDDATAAADAGRETQRRQDVNQARRGTPQPPVPTVPPAPPGRQVVPAPRPGQPRPAQPATRRPGQPPPPPPGAQRGAGMLPRLTAADRARMANAYTRTESILSTMTTAQLQEAEGTLDSIAATAPAGTPAGTGILGTLGEIRDLIKQLVGDIAPKTEPAPVPAPEPEVEPAIPTDAKQVEGEGQV